LNGSAIRDGLSNSDELLLSNSDANLADTDGDTITNLDEHLLGLDHRAPYAMLPIAPLLPPRDLPTL
jgi:hypothetical protein